MDPAFSRPGELPTAFEQMLLGSSPVHCPSTPREQWLSLAQRMGLGGVLLVLDEFGGNRTWMPTREGLMRALWIDLRDNEIRRLHGQQLSARAIAKQIHISRRTVQRVVSSLHGSAPPKREKQAG